MVEYNYQIPCQKIISGGQTGVDRGALDACLEKNFPSGGWCPRGRLAEDGVIHKKYPLTETTEAEYGFRTKKNIIDSDGTLIISPKKLTGGTWLTQKLALQLNKPLIVISPSAGNIRDFLPEVTGWLKAHSIKTLNVAGPRQSQWEQAHKISYEFISALIYEINNSHLPRSGRS